MTASIPLADLFPRFTDEDWRIAAARAKRGAKIPADSRAPIGRNETARPIPGRAAGQPWVAFARVDTSSADEAIAAAHDELQGGAGAIDLVSSAGVHPLPARLPRSAIPPVLGALPEGAVVRVDVNDVAAAQSAARRGLRLIAAVDPVAAVAAGVATAVDVAGAMALAKEGAATIAIADGRPWHAGGASDEQELGIVLASFVHHLRLLGDRIDVTLVADADQFRTIAKFRAMRLLLARLGEVAGIGIAARIHAETAWRSLSLGEPHMNILRAASAAFGAANGGADSITVLSFDALTGGGPHGRRLARNTQTILAPEAQLFRVADPAAGSGAIEAMTAALAEGAWGQFQRIEAAGGIVRAIQDRGIFQEIASERDRRRVQGPPPTGDLSRLVYRRLAEAEET